MRAVTFYEKDKVELVEKPVPEIAGDEILLKIRGAGLCRSDFDIIAMGEGPCSGYTLGHEGAGIVEKIGDEVEGWEVGEAAVVALVLSCGHCCECRRGRDNYCEFAYPRGRMAPRSPGIAFDGAMADYMAVKAYHLVHLGGIDPVDAAPLADAAVTPMHAINTVRHRLTADSYVAISGLGGLGHIGLQIVAATTGATIIALDTADEKIKFAAEHGADYAIKSDAQAADKILEITQGKGVDVYLDFVGVQPTVDLALKVIRNGGAIRFVGLGGGRFNYIAGNEKQFPWGVEIYQGYGGTMADLRQVVALAAQGKITVDTVHYPLDDVVQAFDDLREGKIAGRTVLVP